MRCKSLGKNKLLLLPFFIGLALMIYSWYLTYPLETVSANDFVFYHVSILYWISLPLLLASMFLMALTTKSNLLKWILSVGIVLTLFSLSYFFFTLPNEDSQYFRALTEYFVKTKSLDPTQFSHNYYQWPAYFILADIITSTSGLQLASYEFLLYAIIGFLLATVLYVYGSKKFKDGGVIAVVAFFVSIYYFIDYQAVPFSLALGLLFLLFMLETRQRRVGLTVTMLVLYMGLLFTHLFVPLFFVLYLLMRSILDKNGQNKSYYRKFFLMALASYLLVEFTLARFSFVQVLNSITQAPLTYSQLVSSALTSTVPNAANVVAQLFSRTLTIGSVGICVVGLILLLVRRKSNALDMSILLTGVAYSGLGFVLNTLGYRAIAVAFVTVSLGAAFLFRGKFKPILAGLFLILLVLFVFVPVHQWFNTEISFQTRETYTADNFFISHYNWENPGLVVSDFRTNTYLMSKLTNTVFIQPWLNPGARADAVLYTPVFVGSDLGNYSSMEGLSQGEKLNVVYNDGFSYVLVR